MVLVKQNINVNFSEGLETKTDPFQVPIGKFLQLKNSVFDKGNLLKKRNGYGSLTALPDTTSTYLTTFNGDLTAIGTSFDAYSSSAGAWYDKGSIQPLDLNTLPLLRNNLNQIQSDSAVSSSGLICTVYTESDGSTNTYKYVVADVATGQNIIAPTAISSADATYGTPKVFILNNYFVIIFTNNVAGTYHLKFFTVSILNPAQTTSPVDISTSYTPATTLNFDAVVLGSSLYVAWNGASASGIKAALISPSLAVSSTVILDGSHEATLMSLCADVQSNVVWISYYNLSTTTGYSLAISPQLALLSPFPVQTIASGTILNIASAAQSGVMTLFYEVSNTASGVQTNLISSVTVTQASGTVSSPVITLRSVGLASKAFIIDGVIYLLSVYNSSYQPTFFLVNGSTSTSASPKIVSKLAYQNGRGYLTTGLPSVTVIGTTAQVSYLVKFLVEAVNKNTNVPAGTQIAGVYAQTGINLASFTLGSENLFTSEIGSNLNITGGFLWAYDGYLPVEQGFFLYPDSVQSTANATTGGLLAAQIYFYQVTYEWSDNQGNIFRSAPSIPLKVDLSGSGTSTNTITLVIPTLRVTYKTANPVKIVVYRWSTAQQVYYQTTSISSPTLNNTTTDSVTFVDTHSDASILGNNVLYTTGGVVENISPPGSSAMTLFDGRLWLVDAEDRNLLWFSKQVIESTPVEMSDLLTKYIAPTIGSQGSTGPMTAVSVMDDKFISFKQNAIYYFNGSGPDNTGANNQYSEPIFITSTVGCANQKSIVFIPQGLMFQSDKGIWLLGRDLSTQYIGAPVERYNSSIVQSALNIPETNQVRFTLNTGETLMYDYFYGQWGIFTGVPAISSTLYLGLHTYINSFGQAFQETPGSYLDGSTPVVMSFTTSWLNLAGLQGYQRSYFFYLLGTYYSPHKLNIQISYNYDPGIVQNLTIVPSNYSPNYGGDTPYGQGTPYGGPGTLEQWRIFHTQQRCQSFQITINEIYDPSLGVAAGQGLTLSGLNLVAGIKRGYRPIQSVHSAG